MRVASPFNDYSKDALNLYRVIDPEIWTKLVGRVRGANFGAIYGKTKAMGYRSIALPEGHTWKSYTHFCWIHCLLVCGIIMRKSLIPPSISGMRPEVGCQRKQSVSFCLCVIKK